jgi:3-oxoacyl-[acyl-carrier protein] reductase
MSPHTSLSDKVAVVFGASGGIGAATAKRLAAEGATVVATWRNNEAVVSSLLKSLPGKGHHAAKIAMDDSAALKNLAVEVGQKFGRADILVNTAGFTKPIPLADLDALDDAFVDEMFRVNWRGPFAAVRAFKPLLAANKDGLVVNVSSIAAFNGQGSNLAYAAVKAATDTMTKSLARALAPDIRVMGVSPGVVDTDFVPGRDATALAKIAPTIPMKRVATADDVAAAILACATHLKYSTGSTIVVDGGRAL